MFHTSCLSCNRTKGRNQKCNLKHTHTHTRVQEEGLNVKVCPGECVLVYRLLHFHSLPGLLPYLKEERRKRQQQLFQSATAKSI